jgi:carboxyl-terminal processing protease
VRLQRLATVLAIAVALGGCAAAPAGTSALNNGAAAPALETMDRDLALLTFDSAWSRIAHTHYDTAYGGVDWAGVRAELRPRAEAATTLGALRRVIGEMLQRLGESHYALIPREMADALDAGGGSGTAVTGDAGLAVRLVGDELLVWHVDAGGPADAAGIATGWTLLGVEGRRFADRVAALRALPAADQRTALTRLLYQANAELSGEAGRAMTLHLRDGAGRQVERSVTLQGTRGQLVRFGNLPPILASLEHELVPAGAGCAGVIRMNAWAVPLVPAFDRAIDAMRHCAGIVIDLRGNPGGVAGMVMGTAGHFLDDTLALGFMRTRTTELRFKANPRRVRDDGSAVTPYAGALAILVDEMSASTSEFFAGGLQGVGRARVFGTASAGQALPALLLRLPTQDVLMHVIADFTGPGGVRVEGRGVVPDVSVASSREDLLNQRDAPFSAALQWITRGANDAPRQNGGGTP